MLRDPASSATESFILAAVGILVPLFLGWLTARRGSRVAAYVIGLWLVVTISLFATQLLSGVFVMSANTALASFLAFLAVGAIMALLHRESRRWLANRPGLQDLQQGFS
jgi:beta-lactamase regulating signal transducer with metallopeptidase domain